MSNGTSIVAPAASPSSPGGLFNPKKIALRGKGTSALAEPTSNRLEALACFYAYDQLADEQCIFELQQVFDDWLMDAMLAREVEFRVCRMRRLTSGAIDPTILAHIIGMHGEGALDTANL